MASRSYLYHLENQPEDGCDTPRRIGGLSEWANGVPFSYRVLLSGNPRLCASVLTDGLPDDPGTGVHAINAELAPGLARLRKFLAAVGVLASVPAPAPGTPSALQRLVRRIQRKPAEQSTGSPAVPELIEAINQTLTFLAGHGDRYVQLETIEIDLLRTSDAAGLHDLVTAELAACEQAGQAIDALPDEPAQAATALGAPNGPHAGIFGKLRFDAGFDGPDAELPLGLYWSDWLFFQPRNRRERVAAEPAVPGFGQVWDEPYAGPVKAADEVDWADLGRALTGLVTDFPPFSQVVIAKADGGFPAVRFTGFDPADGEADTDPCTHAELLAPVPPGGEFTEAEQAEFGELGFAPGENGGAWTRTIGKPASRAEAEQVAQACVRRLHETGELASPGELCYTGWRAASSDRAGNDELQVAALLALGIPLGRPSPGVD